MDRMTRTREQLKMVLVLLIILIAYWAKGQVFNKPNVNASTTKNQVMIKKIEMTDDQTIFTLWVKPRANNSVYISSKTYIVPGSGGKKYYIEKVDGLSLDALHNVEATDGPQEYVLYFPPIEQGVRSLNFRAGEDGNYWHFFDIDVSTDIGIDGRVKSGRKGKEDNCKFIEEPGYTAKSGGFTISRIDICDNETVLYFEVNLRQFSAIWIPPKSSIRDSNGGEDMFVIKAEGTNIDERITASSNNGEILNYKLFFPPIDKSVKKIDFREVNKGGDWFVYELDVDVNDL